jgi:GDP-L-fucose synthase
MSNESETAMELTEKKIWVAGHRGMVGSAVVRRLARENSEVITASRSEVNLLHQKDVESFFDNNKPDIVVLAAAKVGGILANNDYPADFLYENLAIQTNVIESSFRHGVKKLLILGSSCIYPKMAPQPIVENALLTGPLETTNEWYAIAKIAGIKLGQAYRRQHGCDFISAMPTNLYGIGDNFDLTSSHVLPALIRKAHDAKHGGTKNMVIWGTGTVRREFLHADDCADALVHLLMNYSDDEHVNVGSGEDISIADLAQLVADIVGFEGSLEYDRTKPDGTPRKLMDSGKLHSMGWRPSISLEAGIEQTYRWFLDNVAS